MGVGLYSVSCGYGCGYGFGGFASLIAMVLALRAREALRMVMGGKVLHGTPGMAKRHSVRMNRHEVWPEGQTRASESPLTWRTDERAMKGRDPKTPSRPSPCGANHPSGAPRARVVPEP